MLRFFLRCFAAIAILALVMGLARPVIEEAGQEMTAFLNWQIINYTHELEAIILSEGYTPGKIDEYVTDSNLLFVITRTLSSFVYFFTGVVTLFITYTIFLKWDKGRLKKKQKLLIQTQKLYIEALSNVNTVFFDYDVRSGVIVFSELFARRHGIPAVIPSAEKALRKIHIDYQGDLPSFSILLLDFKDGPDPSERIFQAATTDGQLIWYSIAVTSTFKVKWWKQQKQRALAVVRDITEEKNAELLLKTKAEQDAMTGLYNKSGGIHHMDHILQESAPGSLHALFVLDLDNFKQVNDVLGHATGDTAITDAAHSLRQIFRQADILCRFGGDEFVVLAANISSPTAAMHKGEEICQALRKSYSDNDNTVSISASVGIALSPTHGQSYDELFKNADEALYKVKARGKDAFGLFGKM